MDSDNDHFENKELDPLNTQVMMTKYELLTDLQVSRGCNQVLDDSILNDDRIDESTSLHDNGTQGEVKWQGETPSGHDDTSVSCDEELTSGKYLGSKVQGFVTEAFNDDENTNNPAFYPQGVTSGDSRNDLLEQDTQTWLVDTMMTPPGHESSLEDNDWMISETDLKANNLRSWFDDTIQEDMVPYADDQLGTELGKENKGFISEVGSPGPPTVHVTKASSSPQSQHACGLDDQVVTVKFLLDEGEVFTRAYQPQTQIYEVREDLMATFHIPPDLLKLTADGNPMQDHTSLAKLGIKPFNIVEIKCISTNPNDYPLSTSNIYEYIKIPDVINVTVQLSPEIIKEVVVEIDNQCIKKPWVGGYFDKKTGSEFHHAFSQTHPRNVCMMGEGKTHRDTQTARWSSKQLNTVSEKATQMCQDNSIPCIHDKVVTARTYVTHQELEARQHFLEKVLIVQKYARGWLERQELRRSDRELEQLVAWEDQAELKTREEKHRKNNLTAARKAYPQTQADFDVLYNMMERWHRAEVEKITALRCEAPKRSEMCRLLEKEVVILSSIEKHRVRVREEKLAEKELDFLEKSSQPIKWTGYKGCTISMDTIRTQRVRELKQMYHDLCKDDLSVEDRVNLLLALKHALKTFETCERAADIIHLMERECECLVRGLKRSHLDILRMRLQQMFLEFIKDPLFGSGPGKHTEKSSISETSKYCTRCRNLLPLSVFKVNSSLKTMKQCKSCWWIENIAHMRTDLWPYRYMMQVVRKEEQRRQCHSSVAFVMQEEDFYHLVVNIWQSRSAISESTDLDDLCMSRWDVDKDWAPWNCILLTHKEARAHNQMKRCLEEIYEANFAAMVAVKQQEARVYFHRLAKVDKNFKNWHTA